MRSRVALPPFCACAVRKWRWRSDVSSSASQRTARILRADFTVVGGWMW